MNLVTKSHTLEDKQTAYLLCVECLPRASMWYRAVSLRGDGSTPDGIFQVFDAVRRELHARVGDLSEGRDVEDEWSFGYPGVASIDVETAYTLLISSLPRRDCWAVAIRAREDGSSAEGVCTAIDELRISLQGYLGNLRRTTKNCTQKATFAALHGSYT